MNKKDTIGMLLAKAHVDLEMVALDPKRVQEAQAKIQQAIEQLAALKTTITQSMETL